MLIKNVSILQSSRLLPGQDIRIEEGKIAQIGPGLPRERSDEVIEGNGMLAIPGLVPVDEAERLIGLLDGLGLRMVLQPAWAAPEQGRATLRRHLVSLLAA